VAVLLYARAALGNILSRTFMPPSLRGARSPCASPRSPRPRSRCDRGALRRRRGSAPASRWPDLLPAASRASLLTVPDVERHAADVEGGPGVQEDSLSNRVRSPAVQGPPTATRALSANRAAQESFHSGTRDPELLRRESVLRSPPRLVHLHDAGAGADRDLVQPVFTVHVMTGARQEVGRIGDGSQELLVEDTDELVGRIRRVGQRATRFIALLTPRSDRAFAACRMAPW